MPSLGLWIELLVDEERAGSCTVLQGHRVYIQVVVLRGKFQRLLKEGNGGLFVAGKLAPLAGFCASHILRDVASLFRPQLDIRI